MTEQEQTTPAPASAPRRVVVAEDESLIRLDIVEILRDNGFDVVGEAGDGETAVQLATETGNAEATAKLRKVVDVTDARTGTVRLRRAVDKADVMALDTASTKTTRIRG